MNFPPSGTRSGVDTGAPTGSPAVVYDPRACGLTRFVVGDAADSR